MGSPSPAADAVPVLPEAPVLPQPENTVSAMARAMLPHSSFFRWIRIAKILLFMICFFMVGA